MVDMFGAMANNHATIREQYLRPAQAAAILHVSPQTVRRWATEGKLRCALTAGGHRRFARAEVQRLHEQLQQEALKRTPASDSNPVASTPRDRIV
jgi:excisionase family DNA binding protein